MAKSFGIKSIHPDAEEGLDFECNTGDGTITLKVDDGENSFENGDAEAGLTGWQPFTSLSNASTGTTNATTYLDLVLETGSPLEGDQSFEVQMKVGQPNYPIGAEEGFFKEFSIETEQLNRLMNISAMFKVALFGNMADEQSSYVWGSNAGGQVGDNTITTAQVPVKSVGGRNFIDIESGIAMSAAIDTAYNAYTWGRNLGGSLGTGNTTSASSPVAVTGGLKFKKISIGEDTTQFEHCVALTRNGTAYGWGSNSGGQLGKGDITPVSSPTAVSGTNKFTDVQAGQDYSLFLDTLGDAYACGLNTQGVLGDGSNTARSTPTAVTGTLKFVKLAKSGPTAKHAGALTSDGTAYLWGNGLAGQLGNNASVSSSSPVAVSGTLKFKELALGDEHTLGLTHDGTLYAWGANNKGQLGTGNTTFASSPVAVSGGLKFKEIAAGTDFSMALTEQGVLYAWGLNDNYRLGNNTTTASSSPVAVSGTIKFKKISAGNANGNGITQPSYAQFVLFNADTDIEVLRSEPINLGNTTQATYSFNKFFTPTVLNYRLAVVFYNSGA